MKSILPFDVSLASDMHVFAQGKTYNMRIAWQCRDTPTQHQARAEARYECCTKHHAREAVRCSRSDREVWLNSGVEDPSMLLSMTASLMSPLFFSSARLKELGIILLASSMCVKVFLGHSRMFNCFTWFIESITELSSSCACWIDGQIEISSQTAICR